MMNLKKLSRFFTTTTKSHFDLNTFKAQIFSSINELKNSNLKDYYYRRFEYDFQQGKFESFSKEKMNEVLEDINRTVSVQNIYFIGNNMINMQKCSIKLYYTLIDI
jgi:hypothetical protein